MKRAFSILALSLLLLFPAQAKTEILDYMPAIIAAANNSGIQGQWAMTVTMADDSTLTLDLNIAKVNGNWVSCEANGQEPITVNGDTISTVIEGYTFTGTIHSNQSMSGTWDQGTWTMVKTASTVFCPTYEPWDLSQPLPKFVTADFTELNKTNRISKFRSGIGHDYSDDYESCRSMKHYYEPGVADWSTVNVFSPVDGQVVSMRTEWAGTQIHIQSTAYPSFTFILFHVDLDPSIQVQSMVTAGQDIGNHIGNQTTQDIAVKMTVRDGDKRAKLVSIFDIMTDGLFATYSDFSGTRSDFIISQAARDGDPLGCSGEDFSSQGTLTNWVTRMDN